MTAPSESAVAALAANDPPPHNRPFRFFKIREANAEIKRLEKQLGIPHKPGGDFFKIAEANQKICELGDRLAGRTTPAQLASSAVAAINAEIRRIEQELGVEITGGNYNTRKGNIRLEELQRQLAARGMTLAKKILPPVLSVAQKATPAASPIPQSAAGLSRAQRLAVAGVLEIADAASLPDAELTARIEKVAFQGNVRTPAMPADAVLAEKYWRKSSRADLAGTERYIAAERQRKINAIFNTI